MIKNKAEVTELILTLIDSTCSYVAPRIQNDRNQFAYIRAMSRCFTACSSLENKDHIYKTRADLLAILHDHVNNPQAKRFEFFSNVDKYYRMGIEHSLDIVTSITSRFDAGYTPMTYDTLLVRNIFEGFNRKIKS